MIVSVLIRKKLYQELFVNYVRYDKCKTKILFRSIESINQINYTLGTTNLPHVIVIDLYQMSLYLCLLSVIVNRCYDRSEYRLTTKLA